MKIRATWTEKRRLLPGDRHLPETNARITHAISIGASPAEIWPWLVQMGCGKAGWYSYDWVDNAGEPSAREILPEHQHLALGDRFRGSPSDPPGEGFKVIDFRPDQYLVLSTYNKLPGFQPVATGESPDKFWQTTWCFYLHPLENERTRLITRSNLHFRPLWLIYPLAQLLARPLHFYMQHKQLNEIKKRAEYYSFYTGSASAKGKITPFSLA